MTTRPATLARQLGLSDSAVAAFRLDRHHHYRPRLVSKRSGGTRELAVPSVRLKSLQRRLLRTLLDREPPHPNATAFVPGRSTVTHARTHADQETIATVDLADFFGSTPTHRVRRYFRDLGHAGPELDFLVRLTTHRGALPQGAPTSPALSNLVNKPLDEELDRLARHTGGRYSRYADDLAFSWPAEPPPGFCHEAEDVLARHGYRVQPQKPWQIVTIAERPVLTGIILRGHGRLGVPWQLRVKPWRLWWATRLRNSPRDAPRLAGLRGYVRGVKCG